MKEKLNAINTVQCEILVFGRILLRKFTKDKNLSPFSPQFFPPILSLKSACISKYYAIYFTYFHAFQEIKECSTPPPFKQNLEYGLNCSLNPVYNHRLFLRITYTHSFSYYPAKNYVNIQIIMKNYLLPVRMQYLISAHESAILHVQSSKLF